MLHSTMYKLRSGIMSHIVPNVVNSRETSTNAKKIYFPDGFDSILFGSPHILDVVKVVSSVTQSIGRVALPQWMQEVFISMKL